MFQSARDNLSDIEEGRQKLEVPVSSHVHEASDVTEEKDLKKKIEELFGSDISESETYFQGMLHQISRSLDNNIDRILLLDDEQRLT
jgi:hypothetical protein